MADLSDPKPYPLQAPGAIDGVSYHNVLIGMTICRGMRNAGCEARADEGMTERSMAQKKAEKSNKKLVEQTTSYG
jgi:hypothetical protein